MGKLEAITQTEDDDKEKMQLRIQNKSKKDDYEIPEMEPITSKNEYLQVRRLKYAGVVLGSFVFIGLITYICCGPKSNLNVGIKNTDANKESIRTKNQEKADRRWTNDKEETEVETEREVNEEVDHDTRYKSNIVDKETSEKVDKDVSEEVDHDTGYKSNIVNKENSEKSEPEGIITENKLLEGGQKQWGVNPWLYAGVIVGSFISIGLATYMWSGNKSDSDAKTKKNEGVTKNDRRHSKSEAREHLKSKMERSTRTNFSKATLETPAPERIANNDESDEGKGIGVIDDEDDSRCNSPSRDGRWHREGESSVIRRPTRTEI